MWTSTPHARETPRLPDPTALTLPAVDVKRWGKIFKNVKNAKKT